MEDYSNKFMNHHEKWISRLDEAKDFMKKYNRSPSRYSKDDYEAQLGSWVKSQKNNCKNSLKMFQYGNILSEWTNFTMDFKKYLLTNEETWYDNLNKLKNYIDTNKKRPPCHSKNKDIEFLSSFIMTQRKNYRAKTQIMAEKEIYDKWTKFENDYDFALKDADEKWFEKLDDLRNFLQTYKKRPNKRSSNQSEKILGEWLGKQTQNLSQEKNNMKKEHIKCEFLKFMEDWKEII